MARRLILVAVAAALLGAACRAPSEIRPAFTRERDAPEGSLPGSIVYTGHLGTVSTLFVLRPGDSRSLRLSPPDTTERSPALSPDETRIAFSVVDGDRGGIYTSALDGGDRQPVVDGDGVFDHPTWSPDGERITYAFSADADSSWDLYVVDANGEGNRRLTSGDAQDWSPSWAPTGDRIAFVSDADGDDAIWLIGADGNDREKIIDSEGDDIDPAWTPDGAGLFFASNRELDRWQLWAYDTGSGEQELVLRTTGMDRMPTFSPDGEYILVSVGYLAVYRADGEKFPDGADRWKLNDDVSLRAIWTAEAAGIPAGGD